VNAVRYACFLFLLPIMLPAFAAAATEPSAADRGRRIYEQHCMECHGSQGRGDGVKAASLSPRPGNLVSAATSAKSDKDLLKIIANGRPRTAMPAWKDRLSEQDQQEVLRYIRSLVQFHRSVTPPPPASDTP
jgi:mono/diheme cytochrome c family protein